jgi:putative intracellular protease/amidase
MKILMILTSHGKLGETGEKTGFWLEEFAAPYYVFRDAGAKVVLASPVGGAPPLDPKSAAPEAQTPATKRFDSDAEAQKALASTEKLSNLSAEDFDAVFYPGGHGPLWDLVSNKTSIQLVESFYEAAKPVAAVCHGPAVLRHAQTVEGRPIVQGKSVTGFSNAEEAAAGLTEIVPFLVEEVLKEAGGRYSKAAVGQPHVVTDGNLITGQNPASSEPTAHALLKLLCVPAA